jgi:hypothetical protein
VVGPYTFQAIEIHWKTFYRRIGWRWIDDILVGFRNVRSTFNFLDEVATLLQSEAWVIDLQMCLEMRRYYRILVTLANKDFVSRVDLEKMMKVHT